MSRIIAGDAGSIRLKPAASVTRPTSDRVKESLFAQLEAMGAIELTRVLDLFAGTGALGLEALSRGANSAVLVERDKKAGEITKLNIAAVMPAIEPGRPEVKVELKQLDAEKYLQNCSDSFDLVFLDPPYDFAQDKLNALIERVSGLLNDDALVVVERSSKSDAFIAPTWAELVSEKSYGDTRVSIIKKN